MLAITPENEIMAIQTIFVADLAERIVGRIQVATDSYRPYQSVVRRHFLERLDFATMQKLYSIPFDAKVEAIRRYSLPRCTGVKVRIQAGTPGKDRINRSFVERVNLTVMHINKRFTRLGMLWSRKLENHKNPISLFFAAYNSSKVHNTLGCTPSVDLKLATETWTIEKLVETASSTNKETMTREC